MCVPKTGKNKLVKFDVLKQFIQQGPLTVQVTGSCMNRSVAAASDVRLEESMFYWPGDIIAFKRGEEQLVSHRFLGYLPGRSGCLLITRADNAQKPDSPVARKHVLGRVTHINGCLFRPDVMDRIGALAAWLPAIYCTIVKHLRKPASVFEKV